jgi:transposase
VTRRPGGPDARVGAVEAEELGDAQPGGQQDGDHGVVAAACPGAAVGRGQDGGALGKEIEEAFHSHPLGEILASLPGIGPRTGARIPAEIGDSSGFASGAKLAAYAGLAPVTRQSGTSLNAEIRSRRGNHQLKCGQTWTG